MYKVQCTKLKIIFLLLLCRNCSPTIQPGGRTGFLDQIWKGLLTEINKALRGFGPIIWNEMLPESLKSSVSLESFKESIKGWIPTNCKCDLCRDYIQGVGYVNITE